MRLLFLRLRGKWRMWLGLCPCCNSDAPELYTCPVCCFWERGMSEKEYADAAGKSHYGPKLWPWRWAKYLESMT